MAVIITRYEPTALTLAANPNLAIVHAADDATRMVAFVNSYVSDVPSRSAGTICLGIIKGGEHTAYLAYLGNVLNFNPVVLTLADLQNEAPAAAAVTAEMIAGGVIV